MNSAVGKTWTGFSFKVCGVVERSSSLRLVTCGGGGDSVFFEPTLGGPGVWFYRTSR